MKSNHAKFASDVDSFFNHCLAKFGYKPYQESDWQNSDTKTALHFSNLENMSDIHITLSDFQDGRWYIQLMMRQKTAGRFGKTKSFFLGQYIKQHSIKNFSDICTPGEDFEEFIKKFFQNLTVACDTYLHDQIAGISFEEHDPAPGRV